MSETPAPANVVARLVRRSEFYSALLVGATLLGFVVAAAGTDAHALLSALMRVGPWPIAAVLALASSNYALRLIRFRFLMQQQSLHVPIWSLARIYVAGFAMTATPGKVGEFARLWFLKTQYGFRYRAILPALIVDRADDVFATVGLCVLTAGAFTNYMRVTVLIALLLGLALLLIVRPVVLLRLVNLAYGLIRRKPRLFARVRHLIRDSSRLCQPRPLAVGIILGCLGWFCESVALYLCASVFGHVHLAEAVFIFTFANLLGAATMLPGGVGGTEVSMVTLLVAIGLRFDEAAAVTLIVRVGTLWYGIGCGYVALFGWMRRRAALNAETRA